MTRGDSTSSTASCFQCCCCFIVHQTLVFCSKPRWDFHFFSLIPALLLNKYRALFCVSFFSVLFVLFLKSQPGSDGKTTTISPTVTCVKVEPLLGLDPTPPPHSTPTGRMSWPLEVYFRRGLIFCLIIRLSSACAVVSWEARKNGSVCVSAARKYITKIIVIKKRGWQRFKARGIGFDLDLIVEDVRFKFQIICIFLLLLCR